MAFETVQIAPSIYHLQSGANSGVIVRGDEAILIDAGLDDDAGRRIRKALDALKVRLVALILTHGHADHFGGASYLRRNLPPFSVYAPAVEAAFIANPTLEGIMLSAGALPFDALTSKFTLAPGCTVDQQIAPGMQFVAGVELEIVSLAGHSPNQIGVQYDEILFSADAFLPIATLAKYPVPFTVHIGKALDVLHRLDRLQGVTFAPGHGAHLPAPHETISANIDALQRVLEATETALKQHVMDEAEATQQVCRALGDGLPNPVSYYLARATVQAALVCLYEQSRAKIGNEDGRIVWSVG